ncbi:hypothetical protein D3C87_1174540 [compost metagenome]
MKAFVSAVLLLLSVSSQAEVVSFTVPTPSSHEGLYLCNAGVAHQRAASSTASPCVEGGECSDEAVSDPARGNDGISYQALQDDGLLRRFAISAPKNGNYSMISPMNGGWNKKITDLTINLSSEVYGAKYFLEFCYQGPIEQLTDCIGNSGNGGGQGTCGNNGNGNGNGNENGNGNNGNGNENGNGNNGSGNKIDQSLGIYQLQSSLFANTVSYIKAVDLATRISWSCDLRATGSAQKPRAPSELAPLAYEIDSTQSVVSSLSNISATALSFTHTLNSNTSRVPRFCVVRFEFAEDTTAVRTSLAKITEFTVYLNFFKSNF